mmetsp:Transcript_76401/g.192308  ORF Transcript_76401/g.192308 Transcript_76401/m.192308 type:complete len:223 (-) Transcript_76401:592-1260(-)
MARTLQQEPCRAKILPHTPQTAIHPSRAARTSKQLRVQARGRMRSQGAICRRRVPCNPASPHAGWLRWTPERRCSKPFGLPKCRCAAGHVHLLRSSHGVLGSARSRAPDSCKRHPALLRGCRRWTRIVPAAHCTLLSGCGAPHSPQSKPDVAARVPMSTCKLCASIRRRLRGHRGSQSPPRRENKSVGWPRSGRSSGCGCTPRTCSSSGQPGWPPAHGTPDA